MTGKRKRKHGGSRPRRGAVASVMLRVRLTPAERDAIGRRAEAAGIDMSEVVRRAVFGDPAQVRLLAAEVVELERRIEQLEGRR